MTQKRKIITALDITKIQSDEKKYNDAQFALLVKDNDYLNVDSIKDQQYKVETMDYYCNLPNYAYNFYLDTGTLTDVEKSPSENGYDLATCGDAVPRYGAIIPAGYYQSVEKISAIRFAIPVHILFYE